MISIWYFTALPLIISSQTEITTKNSSRVVVRIPLQHLWFFWITCIQSPSERILNFWLPVRRRINERTLLADISGWERRRRRLVRRFAVAAAGTPTAVAPARGGGGSDGSLSSWAALQDTIWHCTLRRSDYLESMRSWAAKGQLISKANFKVFISTKISLFFCPKKWSKQKTNLMLLS